MYAYLCARLPPRLVNALYAGWYAFLLLLVFYFFDRNAIDFYYLHR